RTQAVRTPKGKAKVSRQKSQSQIGLGESRAEEFSGEEKPHSRPLEHEVGFKKLRTFLSFCGLVTGLILLLKKDYAIGTLLILMFTEPLLQYMPFVNKKNLFLAHHAWLVAMIFALVTFTWFVR
ncbi:MAG: hypothetical protein KDD64_05120, partial [Bdellovibrionales bacterium]|nr:hypothetical protein [Bdellovibrionales bacterium]